MATSSMLSATPTTNPPDVSGFGDFSAFRRIEGGHRNRVWRVSGRSADFVAKSTSRSEAALRWLSPVQAAARAAGFVVPEMVAANGRFASNGWTLEPFVEGLPATKSDLVALSPRLKTFHATIRGYGQRPGFASVRALLVADAGGDVDMAALPPEIAKACRAAWSALSGNEVPLHGDIGVGNVIMTATGPALIDWDEARCDLAMFDLIACTPQTSIERRAHLAWEIASGWQREPDYARKFVPDLLAI